jgi:glucose-1-phosphate adenylyltransferase
LAFVLAGGEGRRLHPLTLERAKPALEVREGHQIVDFVLANLVNSGVHWIYVLVHYKPGALVERIEQVWQPALAKRDCLLCALRAKPADGYEGTADAVYRHLDLLAQHDPHVVAVFAADHVYRMDLRPMVAFHHRRAADITIAAVPVPLEEAHAFGVLRAGDDGRVDDFQEKPAHPAALPGDPKRAFASMGNYLFHPSALLEVLEDNAARGGTDLGHDVLPGAVRSGTRVFAYDFSSNRVPGVRAYEEAAYWRDVGTLKAFTQAQRDVSGPTPLLDLRNRRWPLQPARNSGRAHRPVH